VLFENESNSNDPANILLLLKVISILTENQDNTITYGKNKIEKKIIEIIKSFMYIPDIQQYTCYLYY
jgi:hypothetical protein